MGAENQQFVSIWLFLLFNTRITVKPIHKTQGIKTNCFNYGRMIVYVPNACHFFFSYFTMQMYIKLIKYTDG